MIFRNVESGDLRFYGKFEKDDYYELMYNCKGWDFEWEYEYVVYSNLYESVGVRWK